MEILSTLLGLGLLASVVEFVVQIIKGIIPKTQIGEVKLPPIYAAIIGVVVALGTKTDIFAAIGFTMEPQVIGWIITGLAISGGSTGVHELISRLRESRGSQEVW